MNSNKTSKVIFLAYTSLFLLGLSDNVRGPLYPEILREFSLNDTQGSLFFALSSAFGILGSYFSGKLYLKWGAVRTLRMSFLILTAAFVMMSVSPSFYFLLLGVVFFGLSLGLMGVVQNVLIVQEIPVGPLKNRILSGLHSMYAAASLAAPLLIQLIDASHGETALWRWVFASGSFFSISMLLATYAGPQLAESTKAIRKEPPHPHEKWAQIYFGVMLATYVLSEILVSTRLALYMRRQYESNLTESVWYTAYFFVGLLLGRVLFSFWSPSFRLKHQTMLCLVLTILSLLVGIWIHPLGLAASGLFMAPFYPLMMSAAGHLFPHSISQALSWAIALSSFFIVLMHFLVGSFTDLFGLQKAFLLAPFFMGVSLVMIVFYEKVFRRLQHSF
ncbi:MAG: sugar MFS transporter [Pseudobdellovibrionaceae bacterium]